MAAGYAASLLKSMRTLRDLAPNDPYSKVVMALYDAMVFDNRWADYTSEQYGRAHNTLMQLAKQTNVDRTKVGKAIVQLESLGFNTTPYGMPFVEEET